jgi:hypothetical protein
MTRNPLKNMGMLKQVQHDDEEFLGVSNYAKNHSVIFRCGSLFFL